MFKFPFNVRYNIGQYLIYFGLASELEILGHFNVDFLKTELRYTEELLKELGHSKNDTIYVYKLTDIYDSTNSFIYRSTKQIDSNYFVLSFEKRIR